MYDATKPYKAKILEMIKKTWKDANYLDRVLYVEEYCQPYPVASTAQGYGMFQLDHMDGIGTKGLFHWKNRTFKEAAQDAFAMNINDLAIARATPTRILNHIVLPTEDTEAIFQIIEGLVDLCLQYKVALVGGETSIEDTKKGMDITVAMNGVFYRNTPNIFKENDVLIGIPSSGLHSNGFTKVREVYGNTFYPEYVIPTRIYFDDVKPIWEHVNAMCHITGGAYTKLKSYLPNVEAIIDGLPVPQQFFKEMHSNGVTDEEMYTTFNCGIGFILGVEPQKAVYVQDKVNGQVIGKVVKGDGKVVIDSQFSKNLVQL